MRFGPVDRPSVYRALAQLEADGLVEAWSDAPVAGSMRRVYGLTADGGRVLRAWMGVIKRGARRPRPRAAPLRGHRARSTRCWPRPRAGWWPWAGTGLVVGVGHRPRSSGGRTWSSAGAGAGATGAASGAPAAAPTGRRPAIELVPDRSAVLDRGPLDGRAHQLRRAGHHRRVEVDVAGGDVAPGSRPAARVEMPVTGAALGQPALRRRAAAAHRRPRGIPPWRSTCDECTPARGRATATASTATATVHGVTRPVEGTVVVHLADDGASVVSGEQVFDIRDFGIESPTVLMLRIYPDVTVRLQRRGASDGGSEEVAPMKCSWPSPPATCWVPAAGSEHLDERRAVAARRHGLRGVPRPRRRACAAHAGHTLRELAAVLEHRRRPRDRRCEAASDLVARVRDLAGLR